MNELDELPPVADIAVDPETGDFHVVEEVMNFYGDGDETGSEEEESESEDYMGEDAT